MKKSITFLGLIGCAFLIIAACNKEENKSLFFDEVTVAEVNGKKINLTEFNNYLRYFMYGHPSFSEIPNSMMKTLYEQNINELVDREILLQEAEKHNITIDNDKFQVFLNSISAGHSPEEFEFQLKEVNLELSDWRKLNRERYLISKLIDTQLFQKIEVSDIDISEYISNHPEIMVEEKQYEVQQVMVQSAELAELILKDLHNGASFTEYVDKYSIAADKINEGNMGYITQNLLPAELSNPIFELKKKNQLSPIIKSGMGYHIFKLLSIKKKRKLSKKEVKDTIVQKIKQERLDDVYKTRITELREKSAIKIDLNAISNDNKF